MSWQFHDVLDEFPRFAAPWDELNSRLYDGHPLLDARFVGACVEFFAKPGDLLAVHRKAKLIDGMAIVQRRAYGCWRTMVPAQAHVAPVLIGDLADALALMVELPGRCFMLDFLCQDPLYTCFDFEGPAPEIETVPHALTTSVALDSDFDAYWRGRSRKLRQNVRRSLRLCEHEGLQHRFVQVCQPGEVGRAVQRYATLESRSWKEKTGTALRPGCRQSAFYQRMLEAFATTRGAAVFGLEIDGRLAGSLLTIRSDRMSVLLKSTYSTQLARFSPGWLTYYFMLQQEFLEHRRRSVEYYTNATPMLLSWATDSRTIRHVCAYRSRRIRHGLAWLRSARHFASDEIRAISRRTS